MRKFFFIICILMLFSSLTFAQSARKSGLLLSGGFSAPAAPEKFYNNWQVGIDLGGGLEFALSRSVALVLYFDYDQFPVNEEQFLENTGSLGIAGASVSAISFSGNLKAYLNPDPEVLSYYLIFGAGHSKFAISEAIIASDEFVDTFESASESVFWPHSAWVSTFRRARRRIFSLKPNIASSLPSSKANNMSLFGPGLK